MRSLRILVAIVALTGCVSEKKRAEICATCPQKDSIVYKDSIRVERYDSTIYVSSPPETLILENPCPDSKPRIFDVKQKKNGITQEIKSDGKTITVTCQDDSLMTVIRGLNIERILSKEAFEERLRTTNICPETWLQTTYQWGFWILLLIFTGSIVIKYFLKVIKFP